MNNNELLNKLLEILERLDIELRFDTFGESKGGLCKLRGKTMLVLDQNLTVGERVEKIIEALKTVELGDMHLPPAVRNAIYGEDAQWEN